LDFLPQLQNDGFLVSILPASQIEKFVTSNVPLIRRFRPVAKDADTDEAESIRLLWGHPKLKVWQDLDKAYRTVILSDAGAGKTFEMEGRARRLRETGCQAFFLRIECIA
jgi:hypothetical protein